MLVVGVVVGVVGVAALTVCFFVLRDVGEVTLRVRVVGDAKGLTLVVCVLGGTEAPGEEMMPFKAM